MIPYGKHFLDEDDIQAVVEVLRSGWITQGPKIYELESKITEMLEVKYAVAVSSGTAALHLSCLAAGLSEGDGVVTSVNSFVASSNCILYGGGQPVLCDIDPATLNLDPECLLELTDKVKDIKGVIPVHFAGLPCDMERISAYAMKKGLFVIEDASHAFGASYKDGSRVGNCRYSDLTVFSLHPVKGVTAGEGGIITTNSHELYMKLLSLRSHGIRKGNFDFPGISLPSDDLVYPEDGLENGKLNPWYYEMQELGFNYRITDIQCALVLSQMVKLEKFLQRRKEIVAKYRELMADLNNVSLTQSDTDGESSNHIFVIRIDYSKIGKTRSQVMRELSEREIGTQVHYIPISRHPYYRKLGFIPNQYPQAESYYKEALTIPVYYELTDEQVEEVVKGLKDVIG